MNLVQQLAQYQNAPLQTLEAAKRGADPAVSPWVASAILSDRIEKQKRMQNALGAAQGPMPTVAEQQDQELSGIMALQAPQMDEPETAEDLAGGDEPEMAAEGGLMSARVDPSMYDYSGGGIIAFSGETRSDVPAADDTIYDPVTGVPIAGASTREGEDMTLREALGLGNVENRRALERAERRSKEAAIPKRPQHPQAAELEQLRREVMTQGGEGRGIRATAAPAAPAAPAASAPTGIMQGMGSVQRAVTGAPEWADLENARTAEFTAPDLPQTAEAAAAEREAHLKAQGITKKPWEVAAEQTAELRRLMGEEDAARKKDRAERERDERYDTFVANLGSGSFGQSSQGGLRANLKREADIKAEEQRIQELRYNQNLKLNEIDAKARELQYNEATGDVAAAQKNRADLAKLKTEFEKTRAELAKGMSGIRERAASTDVQAATTLAAANARQGAAADTAADKNRLAALRAQATTLKGQLDKEFNKTRRAALQAQLDGVNAQLAKIGGNAPGDVQSPYGPPPQGAVRLKK